MSPGAVRLLPFRPSGSPQPPPPCSPQPAPAHPAHHAIREFPGRRVVVRLHCRAGHSRSFWLPKGGRDTCGAHARTTAAPLQRPWVSWHVAQTPHIPPPPCRPAPTLKVNSRGQAVTRLRSFSVSGRGRSLRMAVLQVTAIWPGDGGKVKAEARASGGGSTRAAAAPCAAAILAVPQRRRHPLRLITCLRMVRPQQVVRGLRRLQRPRLRCLHPSCALLRASRRVGQLRMTCCERLQRIWSPALRHRAPPAAWARHSVVGTSSLPNLHSILGYVTGQVRLSYMQGCQCRVRWGMGQGPRSISSVPRAVRAVTRSCRQANVHDVSILMMQRRGSLGQWEGTTSLKAQMIAAPAQPQPTSPAAPPRERSARGPAGSGPAGRRADPRPPRCRPPGTPPPPQP